MFFVVPMKRELMNFVRKELWISRGILEVAALPNTSFHHVLGTTLNTHGVPFSCTFLVHGWLQNDSLIELERLEALSTYAREAAFVACLIHWFLIQVLTPNHLVRRSL